MTESSPRATGYASDRQATIALFSIAAVMVLLHTLTNVRYGFHRDELQFLADARHLDFGYIVNPPVTALIGRLALTLFGLSLVKIRLFAVLAQAVATVLTGLMAREFGGGKFAQILAGLLVAISPISIHFGTQFFYSSFDFLWWILAAYFLARLLRTKDQRWWLAVGLALGVGLETKYTILTFILGLLAGIVLTPMRNALRSGWFWGGAGIATLLILPNAIWQWQHHFISAHWMHFIHARDLGLGRDKGFFSDQFLFCTLIFAAPIWLIGLVAHFRNPDRRYRLFTFAYLVPLVVFVITKARGYYLGPTYPMLLAMGAVKGELWFASLTQVRRRIVMSVFLTGLTAHGIAAFLLLTPLATGGKVQQLVLANNWDLRDEFGWDELVSLTAKIRDSLPKDQQQGVGIMTGNYGEAGAIELFGPAYHLPAPISPANSWWLRGYPTPAPTTLIVIGFHPDEVQRLFNDCRPAARQYNSHGVQNEEVGDRPIIFVCGGPRAPWPELWKYFRRFQ